MAEITQRRRAEGGMKREKYQESLMRKGKREMKDISWICVCLPSAVCKMMFYMGHVKIDLPVGN